MKSTSVILERIPLICDSLIDMDTFTVRDTEPMSSSSKYMHDRIPLNIDLCTSRVILMPRHHQDDENDNIVDCKDEDEDGVEGVSNAGRAEEDRQTVLYKEPSFFNKDDIQRIRELNERKKRETAQRLEADAKLERLQKIYMIVLIVLSVLMVLGMVYFHPLNLYWYQLSVVLCLFLLAMVINSVWIVSVHAADRKTREKEQRYIPLDEISHSNCSININEASASTDVPQLSAGTSRAHRAPCAGTQPIPIKVKSGNEGTRMLIHDGSGLQNGARSGMPLTSSPIEYDLYTPVKLIVPK